MKTWIKKTIFFISVISVGSFGLLTSAQTTWNQIPEINPDGQCMVCAMTPEVVHSFIQRSYGVLAIVASPDETKNNEIFNSPKWLFNQWVLQSLPNPWQTWTSSNSAFPNTTILNSAFQGLKKNISTKVQWFSATTQILANSVLSRDYLVWFWIVMRPAPFVRDYKKLIDLDNAISAELFDSAMQGAMNNVISTEHLKQINDLTKKYEWWNMSVFSTWWFVLSPNTTYGNLLQTIRSMGKKHRTAVAFPEISPEAYFGGDDLKQISKWNIAITRWQNYAEIIKESYGCATALLACDESFSNFSQNMTSISQNMKKWWVDSIKQIKTAVIRLQKSLQSAKEAMKYAMTKEQTLKSKVCKPEYDNSLNLEIRKKVWEDVDGEQWFVFMSEQIWWIKSRYKVFRQDPLQARQKTSSSENEARTECNFKTRDMWTDEKSNQGIEDFLSTERELLNTQYGATIRSAQKDKSLFGQWLALLGKVFHTSVNINGAPMSSEQNTIPKQIQDELKSIADGQTTDKAKKKNIIDDLMSSNYNIDSEKYNSLLQFENDISDTINQTIYNHDLDQSETVQADSTNTTKAIWAMVQKIRFATKMIWDKQNVNSLINNLGKACEWQCSNAGWVCRSD